LTGDNRIIVNVHATIQELPSMISRLVFLGTMACFAFAGQLYADPADSVVKVSVVTRFPDATRPWSKSTPRGGIGTGIFIGDNRILTNAHVVLYGSEIHVQWSNSDEKVEAAVQVLSRDLDLALLTVKDEKFFEKRKPLPRSKVLPKVKDPVTVFGFPIGGTELSVTKGEVSRFNSKQYGYQGYGREIQISAPVNPGNSGGPAVAGDQMIGVVYSLLSGAQNIAYIVPNEEVEYFIANSKEGKFKGKPRENSPTNYQPLENEAMRRMLKVDRTIQGVVVVRPAPGFPLKEFDIITKIGDYAIDATGNIQIEKGVRTYFLCALAQLAKGNSVPVSIIRDGKPIQASLPVSYDDPYILKEYNGEPIRYFIHGPLVFVPAKTDDLGIYYRLNPRLQTDNSPLLRRFERVRFADEELVVVSHEFRHKVTKGYLDPSGRVVKSVNGVAIRNLRHLVETLRDSKGEFLKIELADEWSDIMIFDRAELEKSTEQILEDNGIALTRRASADMMEVWRGKRKDP
jgi:S1-C subfamily serine protease